VARSGAVRRGLSTRYTQSSGSESRSSVNVHSSTLQQGRPSLACAVGYYQLKAEPSAAAAALSHVIRMTNRPCNRLTSAITSRSTHQSSPITSRQSSDLTKVLPKSKVQTAIKPVSALCAGLTCVQSANPNLFGVRYGKGSLHAAC